ncbi:MAG: hypothetical protein IKH96_00260 [Ruminococcus sp.]|uniref:hypothetical protein n=1 Tax=Ruminococcus sp. TaxID=41978 RepID=UPI0025FD304C|nr:hypothetical protein [Ruminococcus sp.]MBR6994427.1 hypothetical protein [Ruminococcus sp.]
MKIMKTTAYLWIGAAMGIAGQFLGELHGNVPLCVSNLISDMTIWPLVILLIIHRDVDAKTMLRDVFLTFLGLDIGYYGYAAVKHTIEYAKFGGSLSSAMFSDVPDLIAYTALGTAAAAWGWLMVKLLRKKKALLYNIMVLPFIAVQLLFIAGDIISWEYRWSMALLGAGCLAVIIYLYTVKSPLRRRNDTVLNCPVAA